MISAGLKNFTQEVLESKVPVLVDFWGPWCGPCRALKPVLEQISASGVKVVTVDVGDEPELAVHYGVTVIPTLLVFKDGKPGEPVVGLQEKNELLKLIAA